eukprot:gene1153-biopygen647
MPNTRSPRDGAGRVLDVFFDASEVVGDGGSREMIATAFAPDRTRLTSNATTSWRGIEHLVSKSFNFEQFIDIRVQTIDRLVEETGNHEERGDIGKFCHKSELSQKRTLPHFQAKSRLERAQIPTL